VYSEAAGIGRIVPTAVAVPVDADDVVTHVRWAWEGSLSLVPRGSGTSMASGAIGPGVIVDLSRMKDIGEPDAEGRSIWVGPGALRGDINDRAKTCGLRFPVDPSSGRYCTIGGMVSTNAAGARSLRYGATREWVMALDCVFDDGSRAVIRRGNASRVGETRSSAMEAGDKDEAVSTGDDFLAIPALQRFALAAKGSLDGAGLDETASHRGVFKESSGYGLAAYMESGDVVDLIVGSEGSLAIVVGVQLRLAELPAAAAGVLAAFASLDDAVRAAARARAAEAVACELLDRTFLEVAAEGSNPIEALADVPADTDSVLLAEVEGSSGTDAQLLADSLASVFRDSGATSVRLASSVEEQHEIWELRHAASPILARLDPSLKSMQFIEDCAVPPESLADFVRGVRGALDRRRVRGVIFGHAGDAHVHVNPLIDVTRTGWRGDVAGLLDEIVALTSSFGGTLAGEHGDGRLRTPLLPRVWSEAAIALFAIVKLAFDPRGILNPGVKVPLDGQQPIGDIKYDPSLAPLPSDAKAVLDRISEQRAYSELRLALLEGPG